MSVVTEGVSAPNPRIGFVSLGCPKALVDSERILTQLRVEGYEVVGGYDQADLVVVNTCAFIESAQEESLDAIGEALTENGKVVVTGCLGTKEGLIRERFPDVLSITGPHDYEAVMSAVHRQLPPPPRSPYLDLLPASGVKLTPRHYAYLKISEGCNHKCSFCIIPQLRGKLVSRPVEQVVAEAERLVRDGVRELLVVSQDTSAYGVDTRYETGTIRGREYRAQMTDLCQALGELGVWVRLHYVYPYPHVDDVIPLMAEGKVLPYLDMPLQHANADVLRAMRRPAGGEAVLERLQRWRETCPDLAVRSSFIVGFPGETEAAFEELLDFLRQAQIDRVGCFVYSPVEGARANALPGWVDPDVAEDRKRRLMEVQAEISSERLARLRGRDLDVLIDEVHEDGSIGRSFADAPEIDGQVHLPGVGGVRPGDFVKARIVESDDHDLIAVLADD
ncbi:ribosomal protein S12 methylthiotransferase [Natronocella acetinitrilica]|uniref:Ribosomal protein uS12 methylthiotransferase RimO n=1 Tax=Natronocella acetinitrilica TaxID=414046 RepID=A0AAE3G4B7_9GAMM|nr:30S ribosomal protein S12 methylthiotransferase RimO [Natronocella acetinitrilica]MCP1675556.1 ribosomal protein S12 methylthiotransferase [Natronocella acetinitrilica]